MSLTLEQARTLDSVARLGSISKAADDLNKVHSAILYTLKILEDQLELKLLDRSGYRTSLTASGQRIWKECQKLLNQEMAIDQLAQQLKSGWEPYLTIVYDGIMPFEPLLKSLSQLNLDKHGTKALFLSASLEDVEKTFNQKNADIMISILSTTNPNLKGIKLPPLKSYLVAHKSHPLIGKKVSLKEMMEHTFLTVKGSDIRLGLSTSPLDEGSLFHLSGFHSKKIALLSGVGYGWMPEHLISKELKKGTLKTLRWENPSHHNFQPVIYHRSNNAPGKAAELFIEKIVKNFTNSSL